jgi:hypothetical protein
MQTSEPLASLAGVHAFHCNVLYHAMRVKMLRLAEVIVGTMDDCPIVDNAAGCLRFQGLARSHDAGDQLQTGESYTIVFEEAFPSIP